MSLCHCVTVLLCRCVTVCALAVRTAAKAGDTGSVLRACDALRDQTMPKAGVRLEDSATGPSVWKLMTPEDVAAAEKAAEKAAAETAAKEARRAEAAAKDAEAVR